MTDVVVYERPSSLELAPEAWTLASRIANTEFVPSALRNKPEAVLAAILTGHERGIPPMQSLAQIHVIEGKPSIAAELMRALILREGHELWVEESSPTRCTVVGKRAGSTRESKVTWTLDDAKRAGLDGKQNWRKYPGDMLFARATAKLARALFPDVIAGMSYSVEELTDGDTLEDADVGRAPTTTAKRSGTKRKATKAATAAAAPPAPAEVEAAPVEVGLPPLPGEPGYVGEFETVEVVVEVVEGGAAAPSTGGEPEGRGPSLGSSPGSPGGEPTSTGTTTAAAGDGDGVDRKSAAASPPGVSTKATARAKHVAMRCRDVGIDSDDQRHAFLGLVTEGRARSGKELDDSDFALVGQVLDQVAAGTVRFVTGIDGTPRLDEAGEGSVADIEEFWSIDQWKQFVKAHGRTQVAALRHARQVAEALGVEAPSGFAEWSDGRISAAVREWVEAA